MTLRTYHQKRDFKKTPEPRGRTKSREAQSPLYVIQKHAASHLHYDFRLELDGVLLSWAVPKGPSLNPADKRLAMHVEDHPIEYGDFEGTIPKGQYGGGTVMLWDHGTWNPIGDPKSGYQKGHLKFELSGHKLKGRWALIRTHGSKYGNKENAWLLIKDDDEFAARDTDAPIVDDQPYSVVSGRSMDEIAHTGDHEWRSNVSVKANLTRGAIAQKNIAHRNARRIPSYQDPAKTKGAKKAALPSLIKPALCTLVKDAPQGDEWLHEVKYDGYRMVARVTRGKVVMYSRNGKDWTLSFSAIAKDIGRLNVKSAWLDGEVCVTDENGRSNFQSLQNALSNESDQDLIYFVFDIVYLDGYDLTRVSLEHRKQLLKNVLGRSQTSLRYSPDVEGSGPTVFTQTCAAGLEGIVSKRADSDYGVGLRTQDWVKVKCAHRQEMVIGGFTDPRGSRPNFGALLIGVYEHGKLRYSGKVGTGFNDELLAALGARLKRLEQKSSPFVNPPRGYEARGAHWVKPELVAEIGFTEWSAAGALRHPVFIGLREDKKAMEVVREKPVDVESPTAAVSENNVTMPDAAAAKTSATVAGIKLSHPDKVLFPESGLTKLDIAKYYEAVSKWMIPLIKDRPLTMVRCPDGWEAGCFYQKHANVAVDAAVKRVQVPEGDHTATYFAVDSLQGLVALLQWGVLEIHPWGSRAPRPDLADRLILDFDPAEDVRWQDLVKAVKEMRTLLVKLGLVPFLKTTGGKGLHIVIPVKPTLVWDRAKGFTKSIADLFARTFPERFIATMSKVERTGKIFIDYLRNGEGATSIAPYGIRSRKGAPVSVPIAWAELSKEVRRDYFNVRNVPARLSKLREDPWKEFYRSAKEITPQMFADVGG